LTGFQLAPIKKVNLSNLSENQLQTQANLKTVKILISIKCLLYLPSLLSGQFC
jgi:hypothetical protein